MNAPKPAADPAPPPSAPVGVRFKLRELLAELEAERAAGARSTERLDRHEIRKLVKEKGDRRVRTSK